MRHPPRKLRAAKRPPYEWRDHHDWIPDVFQKAIERLDRFKDNPNAIRQLGHRKDMKGNKAMYAPFRYAIAEEGKLLVAHTEILSMRIGRPAEDGKKFEPYSVSQFLKRLTPTKDGPPIIAKRRFQRAGKEMRKYLNGIALYPRAKQLDSGAYVGYAWARRITVDLFRAMGLHIELARARVGAYQRKKGVPYREVLAAEGIVTLDPGSEPLDPRDVAQAFGMTLAEFIAPDTS